MSYCLACGYDDQWSDNMKNVPCDRCGAIKNGDGSVSYDGSREGIEEAEERIKEFDDRYGV